MEDVKIRVRLLLKERGVTVNYLANLHGVVQKTLHNQINDNASMSVSTILLILEQFPDVSAEWLLRGNGSMVIGDERKQAQSDVCGDKDMLIESLRERIAEQSNYIADLRHMAKLTNNIK